MSENLSEYRILFKNHYAQYEIDRSKDKKDMDLKAARLNKHSPDTVRYIVEEVNHGGKVVKE